MSDSSKQTRSRHIHVERGVYYSLRADGTKVYEVRYRRSDGRSVFEVVGTSLKAARARRAEVEHRQSTGTVVGNHTTTLNQVIEDWRNVRQVKPRTAATQDAHVRLFIAPALGRRKVRDITRGTILKWLASLKRNDGRAEELNDGTKALVLSTLSSILDLAVDDELIAGNPVKALGKRKPRQKKIEARILRDGELDAMLLFSGERRKWLEPILRAALYAGLRLGEVCGLEWRDVDFTAGTLTVERQLGKDGTIGTPKGGKSATIRLHPELRKVLAAHRLASGAVLPTAPVFVNSRGERRHPKDIDRAFREARDKAGISEEPRALRFHDLRHTAISRLANTPGVPISAAQEFARHATLATTLGYVHGVEDKTFEEKFAAVRFV